MDDLAVGVFRGTDKLPGDNVEGVDGAAVGVVGDEQGVGEGPEASARARAVARPDSCGGSGYKRRLLSVLRVVSVVVAARWDEVQVQSRPDCLTGSGLDTG